jgi:hypothetical protein
MLCEQPQPVAEANDIARIDQNSSLRITHLARRDRIVAPMARAVGTGNHTPRALLCKRDASIFDNVRTPASRRLVRMGGT